MNPRSLALFLVAAGCTTALAQSYTITTIAGSPDNAGSTDGTGATARFNSPTGLAFDSSGNLIVADNHNQTIRLVTPAGAVSTLAGSPGAAGSTDGAGSAARFNLPRGVAVDPAGNIFVTHNQAVRKITPAGLVTTIAGSGATSGTADGAGTNARFNGPYGIVADDNGDLFVADSLSHTIRKVTAAGVVTTIAGAAGQTGSSDGRGDEARFNMPLGLGRDRAGNLYVADSKNATVRKVAPDGTVTTFAGCAGQIGGTDGAVSVALLGLPIAIAVDPNDNVFIADAVGSIRRVSPSGSVTTVAGIGGLTGSIDGTGTVARFNIPAAIAIDGGGNLFIADSANQTIRRGVPPPVFTIANITTSPQSQHVEVGARVTFTVTATTNNGPLRYQWKKDGVVIPGVSSSAIVLASAQPGSMGFYSVVVSDTTGSAESAVAILTVNPGGTSRLSNISTRGLVAAGGDLTVGFVTRGSGTKSLLVRAVGPTLGSFGIDGTLADPRLDVIPAGAGIACDSNDNWAGDATLATASANVGAFALPTTSKDAALVAALPAASYSARVTSSTTGDSGLAIAEVYDRDAAGAGGRLVNVSTLGFVGTGTQALVPGFVIDGPAPKRLLIRAVGPGLAAFGVGGTLADPQLAIIPLGKTFTITSNDNWNNDAALTAAFTAAGAFQLPASSLDAAVVVRLPPGGYTVTVSGVADTTGRALVEIYDLDP